MTATRNVGPLDMNAERTRIVNRLRRLEGQIRGLQTMIESERDCEEVMTQVIAVKSALSQVGLHVIAHSMRRCLTDDESIGRDEFIDDVIAIFLKYSACVR